MLSFGILISLAARGVLSPETAHGILDEQISLLEELQAHERTGPGARVHIAAGLNDLLYLRRMVAAESTDTSAGLTLTSEPLIAMGSRRSERWPARQPLLRGAR
jgi:hypothetical protein